MWPFVKCEKAALKRAERAEKKSKFADSCKSLKETLNKSFDRERKVILSLHMKKLDIVIAQGDSGTSA